MTDKTLYEDVLAQITNVELAVVIADDKIALTPNHLDIEPEITGILANLEDIRTWANTNIAAIEQQEVMNNFLSSLKTLMTEYSAIFEIGGDGGYGEDWGGTGATGIKVKVEKSGVSSERVFEGKSLSQEDL